MSKFEPKSFGRKLRAAREELDITQTELSVRSAQVGDPDSVRISVPYISALETFRQESRPTHEYLDAIARGLGHKDSYTVYEWAGVERPPDWSPFLKAIDREERISPADRKLLKQLFNRFVQGTTA